MNVFADSKSVGFFIAYFLRTILTLFLLKRFISVSPFALFAVALGLIVGEALEKETKTLRGVATLSGAVVFFSPFLFLISLLVGGAVFSYTQKTAEALLASIFSLMIISLFVILGGYSSQPETFIFFIVAGLLILIFHVKKLQEVFL